MSDFVILVLKTGKTTKYNLKRGLTLFPLGLCEQIEKLYTSSGVLMFDVEEQH